MTEHARYGEIQQLIVENGLFSRPVIEAWRDTPRTLVLVHPYTTLTTQHALPGYNPSESWLGYSNQPTVRQDIRDLMTRAHDQGVTVVVAEWQDIMKSPIQPASGFPELMEQTDMVVPERGLKAMFASEFQDYLTEVSGQKVDFDTAMRLAMSKRFEMVFARYAGQKVYTLYDIGRMKKVTMPDGLVQGSAINRELQDVPFTPALTAAMLTNSSIPAYDRNRKDPEALRAAVIEEENRVGVLIAQEMDRVREELASFFS